MDPEAQVTNPARRSCLHVTSHSMANTSGSPTLSMSGPLWYQANEGGIEWLTGEERFEGGEQRCALLAERGEIAAHAGERLRAARLSGSSPRPSAGL